MEQSFPVVSVTNSGKVVVLHLSSLETIGFPLGMGMSIMGRFFIKQFKCHISQISEEFEDHYLLSITNLVTYFRLNGKTH